MATLHWSDWCCPPCMSVVWLLNTDCVMSAMYYAIHITTQTILKTTQITCQASTMIQHAMLCYLCYALLCFAMLCYALLCFAMLCYDLLWYAMLCYVMLCYARQGYARLGLATDWLSGLRKSWETQTDAHMHAGYIDLFFKRTLFVNEWHM